MQFGLFYEWPNPTLRNWKLLFEEGVEQIQYLRRSVSTIASLPSTISPITETRQRRLCRRCILGSAPSASASVLRR